MVFLKSLFKSVPDKPHGLYERTIHMKPGDISDIPPRYAGNWHILRRGDVALKNFEEAKNDLVGFRPQSSRVRCRIKDCPEGLRNVYEKQRSQKVA